MKVRVVAEISAFAMPTVAAPLNGTCEYTVSEEWVLPPATMSGFGASHD